MVAAITTIITMVVVAAVVVQTYSGARRLARGATVAATMVMVA
jgi:hypothetical protein